MMQKLHPVLIAGDIYAAGVMSSIDIGPMQSAALKAKVLTLNSQTDDEDLSAILWPATIVDILDSCGTKHEKEFVVSCFAQLLFDSLK